MCGLAGFYSFTDTWKLDKPTLVRMLADIQDRGKDATGYATQVKPGGKFFYGKAPMLVAQFATEFLGKPEVPVGFAALLHTRSASVGSEKDNRNNHPICHGDVIAVHNGTINVADVAKAYKEINITPIAEVDSSIFPVLLHEMGIPKGVAYMNKNLAGTGAVVALLRDGSLFMARDGRPLYLGRTKEGIVWSSDGDSVLNVIRQEGLMGQFWGSLCRFEPYTYLVLNRNGKVAEAGEFKLPTYFGFLPMAGYQAATSQGAVDVCDWPGCAKKSRSMVARDSKILNLCNKHVNKANQFPKLPF